VINLHNLQLEMMAHELSAKSSELSRARAETTELDARMTDVWQRACDAEAGKDKLEHDVLSLKVSALILKAHSLWYTGRGISY